MKKWLLAFMVMIASTTVSAVTTEVFHLDSIDQFLGGEAKGVEIGAEGYLIPGPELKANDLNVPSVWSCLAHSSGRYFVGAGNSGKVFMKDGKGYKEVLDTEALAVTSLAEGPGGDVYASTAPGGKIFRLNKDGSGGKLWVTLPDQYIWSIAFGKDSVLYAGTGPDGHLFAIDRKGDFSAVLSVKRDHVVRVAPDPDGGILAGTSKGLLYKVEGKDSRLLISFPKREISALAVAPDGEIILGVNTAPVRAQPPQALKPRDEKKKDGEGDEDTPERISDNGRQGSERQRGNFDVYRFRPDGAQRLVLRAGGMIVTDLAAFGDGSILIATGNGGKIIKLNKLNEASLWADVDESIVTSMATKKDNIALIGVANPGVVYEVGNGTSQNAVFTSEALDAKFISQWGRMTWKSGGKVKVETRSGNSDYPDEATWSEWTAVSGSGEMIKSLPARFIQFRISWGGSDASVSDIRIPYRPANQPPVFMAVQVKAPGFDSSASQNSNSNDQQAGRPEGQGDASGVVLIRWKIENPDRDDVVYRLDYRKEGESVWVPVTTEDITKTGYRWDVSSVPDGWYRIRVTVSDSVSNPAGGELTDVIITEPFLIDNGRPEVTELKIDRNNVVTGAAQDGFSRIVRISYSLDGGPWNTVWPTDGLLDQTRETFKIELGKLKPGEHNLAVTTVDEGGNQGVGGLIFTVR